METPEVVDPLKEEEQTTFAPPPVKEPEPIEKPDPVEEQTEDAFSVRDLAEKRLGKIGTGALDFVPIVGDVLAAGDVADSYREGDTLGTAVNAVALGAGIVPVVGDFVAKGLKAGLKSFRRAKAETEAPKFVDEVGETKTIKKAEPTEVSPTSKTVKAYKLFKTDKQGNLYPLFVKMQNNKPIEMDKWIKAEAGDIDPKTGKVKSSIGNLAYRPGFHAGDLPIATHIGGKVDLNTGQRLKGSMPPNIREENQVWAEVEMLDNVDWQTVANSRARIKKDGKPELKSAHITDQVPFGGHYRYKTNANMTGNWLIGGELKVNKILSSAEVKAINDKAGVADLPKLSDLKLDYSKGPLTPKAPLPTAIPKTDVFSGKLTLIHGFRGEPPNIVGSGSYTGPRYDGSGGTFGAEGFYLEEPSRLFFNDPAQNFLQKENTLSSDVTFKKAFVLRPETIGKLKKETGIKDFNDFDELEGFREGYDERRDLTYGGNMGEFIADKLKKKGYDGIIVRDFEQPASPEDIYLRVRKKGDPPNLQALHDDPSPTNLKGLKPKYSEKRKQDIYERMEVEEIKDFNSKAPGMTEELIQPQIFYFYPEKMKNVKVLNPKYTEFKAPLEEKINPKYYEDIKRIKNPEFNKGGMAMEQQMEMAFMNEGGVLADDGVERDPVSGNEVPSGSMAEEVRDDIPAMLSEGEYVVPADVVRYHGIEKFEDLRNEAKVGLQRMEADGRIGGQPVQEQDELPFSIEELQVTEAYRGGIMGFQSGGDTGSYEEAFGQSYVPNQRYGSMGASGLGFQLRNFTSSKTGKKITVPFFNGKPMQYIPPEYTASDVAGSGVTGAVSDDASRQEDEAEKARLVNQFGTSPTELTPLAKGIVDKVIAGESSTPQVKPFSQYSPEDFGNYLKQRQSGIGRVFDNLPIVGLLTTMQDNAAREFARKSLIQGKNFVTGESITNKEADILMQVADMPEGKSLLSTIESFLTGKPSIEIDDRPPIDTELRRTTYEPQTPLDTQQDVSGLYGRGFTPEQIGDDPAVTQQNIVQTEQVDALPESPEKESLIQKMKNVGYSVLTALSPVGPTFGGGLEGLDFSALDSEAYNVGLSDYNALSDKEQNRVKRLVRSEAIGEGDLGMAAVFRSVLTRYGLTKTGAVPLNTFNPGINLSGTSTQAPAALTKENLTFNDIIDGRRAKRDGNVIFQYSPVDDKSINKPLTKTQREAVDRSITLATNTTELAKELYKQDLNQDQVFEIINATNFRRFDAPGADAKNPKLFDHLFDSGGNQPFKANVQQIKDLTNKALQLDKPAVQPQTGFQNIIEPQPVDPTGLYGRGFTPSDIKPLEIEEMDLPPAEGVTPAVEVIEGGTTGSKARRDTQLRPDTQTGVNQFLTPTDVSAGSATRRDARDMPPIDTQMGALFAQDTSPVSKLLTQGEDPYAPPDQPRQVTDPKAFLRRREQDRLKAEAAEKARLEAEAAEKARLEAEAAERARLQRIEQEKKIYEETQARIAKQMADAAKEQQQKKDVVSPTLEALKKDREERDRIKKTNQMNQARNEVIMAGGDPFEADKAAHAVFLDQSDAIRRNEELNRGKTLTQVIQEENRREEDSGGGSGGGGGFGGGSSGGDDKIVCTEMYRQTQLVDWQKAMKIWDVYQRRYLTPEHQIGYHWLFKPYVKGMQRNRLLTKLGAILAKRRTQHLKHILTKGKAKDDLVGKLWCSIIHPIVHKAGKIKNFLDSKTKAT